jgi:hypothetical protein
MGSEPGISGQSTGLTDPPTLQSIREPGIFCFFPFIFHHPSAEPQRRSPFFSNVFVWMEVGGKFLPLGVETRYSPTSVCFEWRKISPVGFNVSAHKGFESKGEH